MYPQTVTVQSFTLETYVDNVLWTNGSTIDWGTVKPDAEYYFENFTVRNTGSISCTVYLVIPNLPVGWSETWQGNGTLLNPLEQVEASLNLTIPVGADGTYNFNSYIRGE